MADNCVFCDRSKFEERIIFENGDFYLIATLGQISDGGYVLIIPKRHVSCLGALGVGECQQIMEFEKRVESALRTEYSDHVVVFEHGIVGQTVKHAHLHLVPMRVEMTARIKGDFGRSDVVCLQSLADFHELYKGNPEPYLLWRDESGILRVCWNPPAPLQYLRTVVAEAVGRPERANWRNMDPVLDQQFWFETITRLKPHLS